MALRNLAAKMRIPAAAAASARLPSVPRVSAASGSRATFSSSSKSEIEKAFLAKNDIESLKAVDLRSNADLLGGHADKTVEAISQVIQKQEEVGKRFLTLSYKVFGSAVVLGFINRMLELYWEDKPNQDRELLGTQFPE